MTLSHEGSQPNTSEICACECCERKVMGDFRGWVIDAEGCDLCPECAYSLATECIRFYREALEKLTAMGSLENPLDGHKMQAIAREALEVY